MSVSIPKPEQRFLLRKTRIEIDFENRNPGLSVEGFLEFAVGSREVEMLRSYNVKWLAFGRDVVVNWLGR